MPILPNFIVGVLTLALLLARQPDARRGLYAGFCPLRAEEIEVRTLHDETSGPSDIE
jgi:hypothetical protein